MEYQVWDVETGTYLGKFHDEQEALKLVKNLVDHFGSEYADSLSLGRVDDDGRILRALSGSELYSLASALTEDDRRSRVFASTIGRVADGTGVVANVEKKSASNRDKFNN